MTEALKAFLSHRRDFRTWKAFGRAHGVEMFAIPVARAQMECARAVLNVLRRKQGGRKWAGYSYE